MKRFTLFFTLLLTTLAHATIFDEAALKTNKQGHLFEMHGSNTIGAALAPALIESWMAFNGLNSISTTPTSIENEKIVTGYTFNEQKVTVYIAAHGSGTGFKQIKNGRSDIAAASRPAKQTENDLFARYDITQSSYETVLAIDGIAVITNPNIPVDSLTVEQVGQLFSGEINNWKQLGGPNLPVTVHARDDKSGTYDTFNTLVLKRGYKLIPKARRYESNDVLSDTVSRSRGAIGFTSLASINNSKVIRIVDGESAPMTPEHSTIATEDYPLARRLYLYQVNTSNPFVLDFLKFAKGSDGQDVVQDTGFISQNLLELPMKVQGELPSGYAFLTENSKRLTTNFRFVPGSKNVLDNKAKDDLERLAEYMHRPENKGRKLLLIGFSDRQTDELKASLMSEVRVIAVKNELAKRDVTSSALTGYGEINPVASNTDPKYALRNQRVEVWIR